MPFCQYVDKININFSTTTLLALNLLISEKKSSSVLYCDEFILIMFCAISVQVEIVFLKPVYNILYYLIRGWLALNVWLCSTVPLQ